MSKTTRDYSLKKEVLATIKGEKVKMRTRSYFIVQSLLIILGIMLLAMFSIYGVSFLFFILRTSGLGLLPEFGLRGMRSFFVSFPWLLLIVALFFVVVLELAVKRHAFAYRRPLLYSAVSIAALTLLCGYVVAQTPLHQSFFERSQEHRLPLAGGMYRGYGMMRMHDARLGVITSINEKSFTISDKDEHILTILLTQETHFPFGGDLQKGDVVMVMGELEQGTIHAFGVRRVERDSEVMLQRLHRRHHGL